MLIVIWCHWFLFHVDPAGMCVHVTCDLLIPLASHWSRRFVQVCTCDLYLLMPLASTSRWSRRHVCTCGLYEQWSRPYVRTCDLLMTLVSTSRWSRRYVCRCDLLMPYTCHFWIPDCSFELFLSFGTLCFSAGLALKMIPSSVVVFMNVVFIMFLFLLHCRLLV